MLLGYAAVPSGFVFSAKQFESNPSATPAADATTGTLKIIVTEDTSVINGSYADSNFGGESQLHLGTADDGSWITARSWFKFDLLHIPREISVEKATLNVFVQEEWSGAAGVDEPVGVYYCADNNWEQMAITWNNQPSFSPTPTSVIDSPASPNMFIVGNWYAWEITSDVRSCLEGDKILSEVLKYTEEWGTQNSFWYPMKYQTYPFNATYIEIEYTIPSVSGLTVDGIASGPLLDFINSPCPDLGWTFSDPDFNDFQKDYEVEVWNNTYYNDTLLWQKSHEFIYTIHDSDSVSGNIHPFGLDDEFRMQIKYPSTIIPQSGIIDKLYFTSVEDGDLTAVLENLEISLVMVSSSADLTTDFEANREGRTPTIVLSRDSYELTLHNHIIEVDIEDTFFVYENLNLIVEIRHTGNSGDLIQIDRTNAGAPGTTTYSYGIGASVDTIANLLYTRTYDLKIGFLTQSVYDIGANTNAFPFGCTIGYPGRFQIKYNQSFIGRSGYLDKMYFPVSTLDGEVVYENFTIKLVETPVLGQIDHVDMESNYGSRTPLTVLDEDLYTVRNLGNVLVIDFDNSYYYSNTNDLLIDFQWDSLVSGSAVVRYTLGSTSSYRAWDLHWNGAYRYDNRTAGYNLFLDFVNNDDSVPLQECITLTEGERYYWRVRTCDSTGIWSDWTTANFKYEISLVLPTISVPIANPSPVEVGQEVTVAVNATHAAGIYSAQIEFGGTNHSMAASGDTYSYAWSPSTEGIIDYTIYVRSNENTWASVSGSFNVTATTTGTGTGTGGDMTMILIVAGVSAVVVVVILVFVMKKKK